VKKIIHVHQQLIKQDKPALIVRTYKGSTHHREVTLLGGGTLVQPGHADSCGARVWIETHAPVLADGVLVP